MQKALRESKQAPFPLTWAIFVDGMPFEIDKPEQQLGGSETAGLLMAKILAARGHEVNLFGRHEREGIFSKVRYHNVARYPQWVTNVPHDVTIVQRVPQALNMETQSHLTWLWMHDLAIRRARDVTFGVSWNVSKILVLSQFHRNQYRDTYGLPESVFHITRNGIDTCFISEVPEQTRDRKLLVYTARPERGMDLLLEETFPRLLRADAEITLKLAGYNNYVEQLQGLYAKCNQLMNKFGGRVQHVGALTKSDLYKLYKTAALYVYPSNFEEISCITAMECMACGLPMVGGTIGALVETLPAECGKLIPWREEKDAKDPEFQDNFVETCLYYLRNERVWQSASEAGVQHAKGLDWEGVAEDWERLAYASLPRERMEQA